MDAQHTTRAPWRSRRWTIIAMGMVLLLVLALLGVSDDVLAPLAMGIGGAMTALQAGESWVDRARVRSSGSPPPRGRGADSRHEYDDDRRLGP